MPLYVYCFGGAIVMLVTYVASPSKNRYLTVTDLRRKAKAHNDRYLKNQNKRGGI